jgi:hypothetical protein
MPYTVEKFMRVYNDQNGDYVEVREDRDALELIEIENSESKHCVTMTIEQALLTPIQKLAINKLEVENVEQFAPGTYRVEPFTVEISGEIRVGAPSEVTPTASIPLIPTLALAIRRMGIQREPFLAKLREVMTEVLTADEATRTAMVTDLGVAEFEAMMREQVLRRLPKQRRAGPVRARVTVTPVTNGIAG